MSNLKTSPAEHADNHRRLLFLTMLLLSMVLAVETGSFLVHEEMKHALAIAGKVFAILTLLAFVLTVFWKLRYIPGKERYYLLTTSDSVANQMLNRACKISWVLTILILAIAPKWISKFHPGLPLEFYVDLTLLSMFGVCSVSFFILFGLGGQDEHQQADL